MIGIILAGGHGTRLGPMGMQLNKALIDFGGRPMIINQITTMRQVGCTEFIIVVSPHWKRQVSAVLNRAFGALIQWNVVVQHVAAGPADAVAVGAAAATSETGALVIMADTFVDTHDMHQAMVVGGNKQWTGCSITRGGRNWCYLDKEADEWVDGFVSADTSEHVAIGCYYFPSVRELEHKAQLACDDSSEGEETPMSPLLNSYKTSEIIFTTWRDTGDITALANARKTFMRSRSFNHLSVTNDGFVRKEGKIKDELEYLKLIDDCHLFPRVRVEERDSYDIEYIDSPTLAELFLYWPTTPGLWGHLLDVVIESVDFELWPRVGDTDPQPTAQMALDKAFTRLVEWDKKSVLMFPKLNINGEDHLAGIDLVYALAEHVVSWGDDELVFPHGDLNFTNILYSIGNDIFRLIDPRGDTSLDYHYDLAKLRYSYRGFAAISHGLFDAGFHGGHAWLHVPYRDDEAAEMDNVLWHKGDMNKIEALESLLFLAGAPLHEGMEGLAMYLRGVQIGNEVLND